MEWLILAGIVAVLCVGFLVWALLSAPLGFEDEGGFHSENTPQPIKKPNVNVDSVHHYSHNH